MQRLLTGALVLTLVGAVVLYTMYQSLIGQTVALRFTQAELQQKLAAQMPISQSYHLLAGSLENPRVSFRQNSDRVFAGVDVVLQLQAVGGNSPVQYRGTLDVSSAIRYAPGMGQLFLSDPKIEALHLPGLPDRLNEPARSLFGQLLGEYYGARPIYTLKQSDIRESAARMLIRNITVNEQQLIVLLGLP